MPRPNMYIFAAMLIMAVMDIAIVSVSAEPSSNLTSFLSRTKRQLGILGNSDDDYVSDPNEPCELAGISYFCYAGSCARDCGIPQSRRPIGGRAAKNQWCYTTKGATGDQDFVSCRSDTDCNAYWNCATPCGAKPNKPATSRCQAFGCGEDRECWSSCNYGKLDKAVCTLRVVQEPGVLKCRKDEDCTPKVNYRCYDKCKPF